MKFGPCDSNMATTTPLKAIVERNYFEAGKVCFFEACPIRIQPLVTHILFSAHLQVEPEVVIMTIKKINEILSNMTEYGGKHVLENIASTASFYSANNFMPHISKEALDKMSKYIQEQNEMVFKQKGLEIRNPIECGMLQLEFYINISSS